MTKMKRIEQIAQGKDIVDAMATLRENRVKRTIEAAIDAAAESAMEAEVAAQKILDGLGKHADNANSLTNAYNSYAEKMCEHDDYLRTKKYLEALRDKLNEEVEVKEDK